MTETLDDSAKDTGIGALLRASRMRVGEELRDIASILRIRYPYLIAIEEGRFDDLPGQPYAVGFVRAYADHLGLDGEEVVRRFKEEFNSGGTSSSELSFPTPIAEASVPGGAIVFIGLLISIIAYGVWYISTSDENYFGDIIHPIPERFATLIGNDEDEGSNEQISTGNFSAQAEKERQLKDTLIQTGSMPGEKQQQLESDQKTESPVTKSERLASMADVSVSIGSDQSNENQSSTENRDKKASIAKVEPPGMSETPATAISPSIPETSATSFAKPSSTEPVAMAVPAATETAPMPNADTSTDMTGDSDKPLPTLKPTTKAVEIESSTRLMDTVPERPKENPDASLTVSGSEVGSRILVRAKVESWVQIKNNKNQIVFTNLLKAGEEYNVPNEAGLKLETGNAGALEILVDGKAVPSIGQEGMVRRSVQMDPALLKAGTAARQ